MDLVGTIDEYGNLTVPPGIAALRSGVLSSLKPGTAVKETLKRSLPNKTHQQVKMLWGLMIATLKQEFDERGYDLKALMPAARIPDGIPIPRDGIMSMLYATCGDVGPNGERKTLSKMDIAEAACFFERCRDYAASAWGIQIPDPDPNWQQRTQAGTGKDEPQRAVSQLNRAKDGPACT